jgi:hypothetical protein
MIMSIGSIQDKESMATDTSLKKCVNQTGEHRFKHTLNIDLKTSGFICYIGTIRLIKFRH